MFNSCELNILIEYQYHIFDILSQIPPNCNKKIHNTAGICFAAVLRILLLLFWTVNIPDQYLMIPFCDGVWSLTCALILFLSQNRTVLLFLEDTRQ